MEELFIYPEAQENNFEGQSFFLSNCSKCDLAQTEKSYKRVRKDWSILLVRTGSVSISDKKTTVSKGEFFIFPPNENQDILCQENASFYWLFVGGKEADLIIEKLALPTLIPCQVRQENLILVLDGIIKEFLTKNIGYEEVATLSAKAFLYTLKREMSAHVAKGKEHLKSIVFSMYSNPHISNTECAEICFMSRENFIRAFKAQYGMTPHKFKQNIIITRAKELLTKTNLTITAISEMLGFSENPLYFNNYFKNIVGMYPLKFRTENQQKSDKNKHIPRKKA